jgi:hypothetical protein
MTDEELEALYWEHLLEGAKEFCKWLDTDEGQKMLKEELAKPTPDFIKNAPEPWPSVILGPEHGIIEDPKDD